MAGYEHKLVNPAKRQLDMIGVFRIRLNQIGNIIPTEIHHIRLQHQANLSSSH